MTSSSSAEHPLAYEFRFFAALTSSECPLYAELSTRAAESAFLLDLAAHRTPGQPSVNLLFAAVHNELLAGAAHPLRRFYRSLGGEEPPGSVFPHFLDFCREREERLSELIATRRVQTNEVGRSALLLPAFARASRLLGERPLHLIELGASAGLHLNLDLYRFEYELAPPAGEPTVHFCGDPDVPIKNPAAASATGELSVHLCGDPDSPVSLRAEVRNVLGRDSDWVPPRVPPIADRTGVDLVVIRLDDADALRWSEALIWPDQVERLDRFRAAVEVARSRPPRMIEGDGRAIVPEVAERTPPTMVPCIFHSHAIYQWKSLVREEFARSIKALGRTRDLVCVSLEWLGNDSGPKLHLTTFDAGEERSELLADCHQHGRWLEWRP